MFKKIFIFLLITVSITFLIENLINSKQLLIKHDIYHHDFTANYSGDKVWGNKTHRVCTDSSGFKINCKDFNKLRLIKEYDLAFMGDSFTEGYDYSKSFVGLISDEYKNLKIANIAVASYSPSIYFYKIKYLLENGYKFKHLVLYVDISDVHDEALYEEKNGKIIINYILDKTTNEVKRRTYKRIFKDFANDYFPYIYSKLWKIKNRKLLKDEDFNFINKEKHIYKKNFVRGSWTYNPTLIYRDQFSVKEAVNKKMYYINLLSKMLEKENIKLSIGIYPWPSQILWDTRDNSSVKLMREFCIQKCTYFFNNNDYFFDYLEKSNKWDVLKKYYIINDIHFNDEGHKILAENFIAKYIDR